MSLATTLMAVGIPAEQANRLGYEDRVPLDGNGTTQGSATELLPTQTNVAMGTGVGDTAFRLPAEAELFQEYFLLNTTAETALIFPPVGDTIDANAVDAAVEIETNLARVFQRVEEGRWVSFPSGEGGGGIETIVAGPGISVDNTDPDNPVVSNTGVLSVSGGAGVSVDITDPQNPVVNNTGVLSVTAGTGISVGGTAQNPSIANGGVLSVSAGSNISVTGTAANPIINGNAGTVTAVSVVSANGFAGSSSGGATPALTLSTTQTGLLSGNGTSVTGRTLTGTSGRIGVTNGTGTGGNPTVDLAAAVDVRDYLDTAVYVADRTALAALDQTKDTVAWLKEAGREGAFQWDGSNLSAFVTLDTQQGIYVPPASATTGASGAWVRRFPEDINVKWFGAKGDLSQDDQPAIQCAVNVAAGRQLVAPVGQYRMNTTVTYSGIINLRGDGNGAGPGPAAQSNSNVTQFLMYFSNAYLFETVSNYPSVFRDFQINVAVANRPATSGAGIHLSGPVGSTNANSKVLNCSFTNCYVGVLLTRPAYATISGCYFDSWVLAGVYGRTTSGIEGSLGFVDGNFFFGTSGSTTQGGCVVSEIGYAIISNNLLLGAGYGVQFAVKNHDAGAFRVFDNFIENQGTTGVAIQTQDTSKASMVAVCRNEFSNVAYTTSFDSSIKIVDYSSGTDWIDDVLIADNVHRHSLDSNARYIWLQSGRNVLVAREQFENLGAGSGTVGLSTTFAGAALKAPFIVRDCTFLGTFQARYSIPVTIQIVEPIQIATAQAVVSLSNSSTSAQNIFAAANDTLTVQPLTTYRFRARLTFNTGGTSHTTSFGLGGTATFTTCNYTSMATSSAANTLATPQMRRVAAATAAALTAASTAVTTDIWIEGIIRINGAGTIIPQVTFSAGPTGTCETAVDSFFELESLGNNTIAFAGNWA